MARANFVKKARKDIPGTDIKAGDSYYWWKFRFGGKRYSKEQPKRSQLTQSAFYSQLYDLQDLQAALTTEDDLASARDNLMASLEDMKSECESNLDNIPDQLREGASGQLLQERIDALEGVIDELNSLDLDPPDEPEEPGEAATEEEREAYEQARAEYEQELEDQLSELQAVSLDAP